MKNFKIAMISILCSSVLLAGSAYASDDDDMKTYEVTVTNLTRGTNFTPIFAAAHKKHHKLFKLGEAVSAGVADMAEGGATGGLPAELHTNYYTSHDALLGPGESVTLTLTAGEDFKYLSLASMMLPTNDGFLAVNAMKLPKKGKAKYVMSPAYDAGSEANDELCENIPGPTCGGTPFSGFDESDEGYAHIHAGIHGIGDLEASDYDWNNPVAKIMIKAIKN